MKEHLNRNDEELQLDLHTLRQMLNRGRQAAPADAPNANGELGPGKEEERAENQVVLNVQQYFANPCRKLSGQGGRLIKAGAVNKLPEGACSLSGTRSGNSDKTKFQYLVDMVAQVPWRSHLFHYLPRHTEFGPVMVINKIDLDAYLQAFKGDAFGSLYEYGKVNLNVFDPDDRRLEALDKVLEKHRALKVKQQAKLNGLRDSLVKVTRSAVEYVNAAQL